jgi:hypothetical protein
LLFLAFPCFSTHFHPSTHFSSKPAFADLLEAFPEGMRSFWGSKSYLFRWVAHSKVWASFSRLKRLHSVGESFENKHEFGSKAFPRKLPKWQGSTLRKTCVFEPQAKIPPFRFLPFVVACCFLLFLVFQPTSILQPTSQAKPGFADLLEAFPEGMRSFWGSKSYLFRWVAHSKVWASFSRLKRLPSVGESFENKHEFGSKAFPRKLPKWQGSTLRKTCVFEPQAKIPPFRFLPFVVACCFLLFLVFQPISTLQPTSQANLLLPTF